jgi:hypothetical protein
LVASSNLQGSLTDATRGTGQEETIAARNTFARKLHHPYCVHITELTHLLLEALPSLDTAVDLQDY